MTGFLLLASIAAAPQIIQQSAGVGQRVQVTLAGDSGRPITGTIASTTSGISLLVTRAGTIATVPRNEVTSLRASRRSPASGFKKGFAVGFVLGAVVFAMEYEDIRRDDAFGISIPLAAITYMGLGPLVFGAAGTMLAGDQWKPTAIPAGGLAPDESRSIRFAANEPVRGATRSGASFDGRVSRNSADSLILWDRRLAWRDVRTIEVRGTKSRVQGALLGGLIGLGVGVVAQASSPTPDPGAARLGYGLMTIGGAILGSKYLAIPQWSSLPVPR